jgi:hypothetical protein
LKVLADLHQTFSLPSLPTRKDETGWEAIDRWAYPSSMIVSRESAAVTSDP